MPNYAIIENGKVVNTVVAEPNYAAQQGWIELAGDASIGWDYVNGQFVDNRPVPEAPVTTAPTKEELLAQLQALQAQIEALG
jgi:phosphoribosylformylglycinamidine (FGAM) synthase-like enzyme